MYVLGALSIHASPERVPSALADVLTRAGAVFAARDGQSVAVSYGSPAGELAACVSAAGIADSSQLTKLELCGPRARLAELVRQATTASLASGGVLTPAARGGVVPLARRGAELIRAQRVVVLCEPAVGRAAARAVARLGGAAPGLVVRDRSRAVVGDHGHRRRDRDVLAALGVFGPSRDPRDVSPFTSAELADVEALWLLQSEHRALALVAASRPTRLARDRAGRSARTGCAASGRKRSRATRCSSGAARGSLSTDAARALARCAER